MSRITANTCRSLLLCLINHPYPKPNVHEWVISREYDRLWNPHALDIASLYSLRKTMTCGVCSYYWGKLIWYLSADSVIVAMTRGWHPMISFHSPRIRFEWGVAWHGRRYRYIIITHYIIFRFKLGVTWVMIVIDRTPYHHPFIQISSLYNAYSQFAFVVVKPWYCLPTVKVT